MVHFIAKDRISCYIIIEADMFSAPRLGFVITPVTIITISIVPDQILDAIS